MVNWTIRHRQCAKLSWVSASGGWAWYIRTWRNKYFQNDFQLGSQDWLHLRERIYAARKSRVMEVCKKYEDPRRWRAKTLGGDQNFFWINVNYNFTVCTHAKVDYKNELILENQFVPIHICSLGWFHYLEKEPSDAVWHDSPGENAAGYTKGPAI